MNISIKKLNPDAVIPQYAHDTDAGLDLTAVSKTRDDNNNLVYGTGLAIEIPQGFVGLLFPRSSVAKKSLMLSNSVGVIDSGYRGEIMFKFKDLGDEIFDEEYNIGDRIGQLFIMPRPTINLVEVEELSDSERGEGGYGSTGE